MIKNFKWLLLVSLTFVACNSDDDEVIADSSNGLPLTSGTADFSKYVALGDSFAAGYSDGALFIEGQKGAYPNLLAEQFATVGGGEFKTPFMADNFGGLLGGGVPVPGQGVRLIFNGTAPIPLPGAVPTTDVINHLTGPFNNLGVPGAKSFHLVASGYGNISNVGIGAANPYYVRFASSNTSKVLEDAAAQSPTFFSLWIGGNDVLSYATSGGAGVDRTGNFDPTTYGSNDITDPNVFANVYATIVTTMTAGGAKGVVANLPYVNTLPYFTTVPYNPVPLDATTITALMNNTTGYGAYNNALLQAKSFGLITDEELARRTISFTPGSSNPVVIIDSYLTNLTSLSIPSYRQATAEDLIVLPARNFIGTQVNGDPQLVNGVSVPLADNWVLSKDEITEVRNATDAYNATIESVANANGLAFVNAKAIMDKLISGGITANGFTLTSGYVTGGAFSLDGVHPSPRGYALIANEFIKAINAKYGSNMKEKDLSNYRILFPANPGAF